ncbi:hypothetical protein ZC59_001037 [Salmonella enterica subsp. salamae]|nr:hypothetical protein [Salmonella enterica subsp. salamae]
MRYPTCRPDKRSAIRHITLPDGGASALSGLQRQPMSLWRERCSSSDYAKDFVL